MNIVRELRKILSSVAFSRQDHLSSAIFWVHMDELYHKCNKLFSSIVHPIKVVITIRETCTNWLVYKHYISDISPRTIRS